MDKCYWCNGKAVYYFKSSKRYCCDTSMNRCPAVKKNNSEKNKGKVKNYPSAKPMLGKNPANKNKKLEEVVGKAKAKKVKKKISSKIKKAHQKGIYKYSEEKEAKRKKKISKSMKGKYGGYRKGSGRGKKGWYKGYWCDSSWELAYVIYNLEHGIEFVRNTEKFVYIFRKRKYKWMPDFIVNGVYYEIKGWMTKRNQAKIDSFDKPLIVLREKDLKYVFDYVINKYGKDFINLYEKDYGADPAG